MLDIFAHSTSKFQDKLLKFWWQTTVMTTKPQKFPRNFREFLGEIKQFGIIHGTHIFVFAAGVFLTPHTPKDHHTKFGTFVRCVTILPLVYYSTISWIVGLYHHSLILICTAFYNSTKNYYFLKSKKLCIGPTKHTRKLTISKFIITIVESCFALCVVIH